MNADTTVALTLLAASFAGLAWIAAIAAHQARTPNDKPAPWRPCDRCPHRGTELRTDRDTYAPVYVCPGHANEGDLRGWWLPGRDAA